MNLFRRKCNNSCLLISNFEYMKKLLTFLLFFQALCIGSQASINFVLDYVSFCTVDEKPYLELYLSINGNSISYAEVKPDLFQANIEVTYLIEKGEKVANFKKFQLNSPEYKLEDFKPDLMDLKRIPLENGEYSLSVIIRDLVNGNKIEKSVELPKINYKNDQISFSQIQLADSYASSKEASTFVKNGLEIIPNIAHTFGIDKPKLTFYAEVYHADKTLAAEEDYLLEYKIVRENTEEVVANLRGIKRVKANSITPFIQEFDLKDLPSDYYTLRINAINRNNEVISSTSTNFFRSNPKFNNYSAVDFRNSFVDSITNKEELAEYIKSLYPISSGDELQFAQNQLEYADLEFMQKYFYNFWKVRNNLDPETEWISYHDKVLLVDKEFGYGKIKGYQTERGRVYLQYGPPNSIQDVTYDRGTYPYSIWQYYKLQGLTNRRFVFYSPSMEMLGYEVLHSNVRGEVNNPGWEADLVSKTNGGRRSNQEDPGDVIIEENARTLFDNPR